MTSPLTIMFAPLDAYGHTNACIGFAEILQERGHRIVFAAAKGWKGKLAPLGFQEMLYSNDNSSTQKTDASAEWTNLVKENETKLRQDSLGKIKSFIPEIFKTAAKMTKECNGP